MNEKQWKEVPGFSGYKISRTGKIVGPRSALKPWTHKSGHKYVRLGRKHGRQVHRLVLLTFIGAPPTEKHEACHRDGNPANNNLSNLYWGTRLENIHDYVKATNRFPKSSLTLEQAESIRRNYSHAWGEKRGIAKQYGLHEGIIGRLINGKTYAT